MVPRRFQLASSTNCIQLPEMRVPKRRNLTMRYVVRFGGFVYQVCVVYSDSAVRPAGVQRRFNA